MCPPEMRGRVLAFSGCLSWVVSNQWPDHRRHQRLNRSEVVVLYGAVIVLS